MATPSPIADSSRFSCQSTNISQTGNLLRHYVKDKRSHGDGYGNSRATMNLFPITGKPASAAENFNRSVGHTVDIYPQFSGFNHSAVANASLGKRGSPEPAAGQMTIFYCGQVMVFNGLPMDKAKEVMDLASTFESGVKKRKVDPNLITNIHTNLNLNPEVTPYMNVANSFVDTVVIPASVPQTPVAIASDLPIARKASLHRFLEKRKDRLIGKVPSSPMIPSGDSSGLMEGKPWLGLGSSPVYQA